MVLDVVDGLVDWVLVESEFETEVINGGLSLEV